MATIETLQADSATIEPKPVHAAGRESAAAWDRIAGGRFYIDGHWVGPGGRAMFAIENPADETVFARVPLAGPQDVSAAVGAARRAFDTGAWPRLSPAERSRFLRAIADGIDARASVLDAIYTGEVGALPWAAAATSAGAAATFRYYAGMAESFPFVERHQPTAGGAFGFLVREPVGVVAAIIPWNAPLMLIATKLAPALLAGCTVVLKSSPEAPLEAVVFAEIVEAAGLPSGVVNVIMADREVSELLVRNTDVDKVSFTGSSAAGRQVASICGSRMARSTLELGGKSAAVVFDDYPAESVVQALVPPMCMLAMQYCAALSRVIVTRSRHDRLVEALADGLGAIRLGPPADPETQMGPLSLRRQYKRVEEYVARGVAEGATLATGGRRAEQFDKGFYFLPTLFGHVDNRSIIAREEIFGPVVCVIPAEDEADAIRLANESDFGLNSTIFSGDTDRAYAAARQLRAGTVGVNAFRSDFGIAFGGFKQSGIGREGGREGLLPYLESKTIIMDADPGFAASASAAQAAAVR
jgi:betaine-aldehyde dehydrogenase